MKLPVSFIDVFALLLAILFILPMKPDVAADDDTRSGMLVIEAHWPDSSRTDVDLWVQAPGDKPVGYSRLRGSHISLYRDDLGGDMQSRWRYEIASTREFIPDGPYVVNLHLFSDTGNHAPIPIEVLVYFRPTEESRKIELWRGTVLLRHVGEEATAVHFTMNAARYVPGSIHYSPVKLRSPAGAMQ